MNDKKGNNYENTPEHSAKFNENLDSEPYSNDNEIITYNEDQLDGDNNQNQEINSASSPLVTGASFNPVHENVSIKKFYLFT